jgi:hypothetical protein
MQGPTSAADAHFLYSIDNKPLGVEVKYSQGFILYFNLVELCGNNLVDILLGSNVKFELIGTNHKTVFEKYFDTSSIFNTLNNDLVVSVSTEEALALKQETYKIKLTLLWPDSSYILFSELDGILSIR